MSGSYQEIVARRIVPHLKSLCDKVRIEKEATVLDGVRVFDGSDVFVPGKTVNAFSYVLVAAKEDPAQFQSLLADFAAVADFTARYELKTWGIFFYLTGLNRLREHGLLERAVRPETLARLQDKLDWRNFIREADLTLIDLPTNYYGCGFGVARLRELLGWEAENCSQKLFDRLMEHIESYSGEFGFSDETPGEGRFDRYSILLPGEICARLIDTGMAVPEQLRSMLRRSCDIHLRLANQNGDGFAYGRTIGAYGDSSVLEVLSVAAYLKVLTPVEQDLAYAYSVKIAAKFADFWLDDEMGSVNLWEKGRKADPYMAKNRILGENFSLCHQVIHSGDFWERAGYGSRLPDPGFTAMLEQIPRHFLVRFASGEYERALAIIRDRSRIISLPLISGGTGQYRKAPYYPIPFAVGMLACSPAERYPQLLPELTLDDGAVLMPLVYLTKIRTAESGDCFTVCYRQSQLCRIKGESPRPDPRIGVETCYFFSPGRIVREDCYAAQEPLRIEKIRLEFATYSQEPVQTGTEVRFGRGAVRRIKLEGLEHCRVGSVAGQAAYQTAQGTLESKVVWESEALRLDGTWRLRWEIDYE